MMQAAKTPVPIQPVDQAILCGPYAPPAKHWHYSKVTGEAQVIAQRRPARYWYKTKEEAAGQGVLELSEGEDDLVMVNQLREDVARWRDGKYDGATDVTRQLLRAWWREDRPRRLFYCQLEAVETVIYLSEILRSGRKPRFNPLFPLADLGKCVDPPNNPDWLPLTRLGCKMATGSGKTVVMAMLIAWAFCNRTRMPGDARFPNGVLVCCPNLTVKERLQVLRPDRADNYYEQFDIVPVAMRPSLQLGKVLVTNWHAFAPESEHVEGGKSYAVVNKGAETGDAFARRVLGDLYGRMPLMVLNDEAHHCYRPKPLEERLSGEEARDAEEEREEATVWIEGLDRINNSVPTAGGKGKAGVHMCVDLSATPFYLGGSGYVEGSPFPWLVSDFGLVDAIESGIVKIPRLPVSDTTGRPDPKYFRLWKAINEGLEPIEKEPGRAGKPKPHIVYREAEAALRQLADQWKERFDLVQKATPGQEHVPPVMIIVCDNTNIAEVFFQKLSGETVREEVRPEDVEEVLAGEEEEVEEPVRGRGKKKTQTIFGQSEIRPEFTNTAQRKHTIRIDSKLLAQAESGEGKSRQDAAEQLRQVVATVGKPGQPGEHVRCVVSVAMLTEGWDANNVTHILGIRAFGSQLLCEQVVGRGLRRMDYTPDRETGLLTAEYVDVYGIPFSVIPFKGREGKQSAPEDRPKNHVQALPERKEMELRFPVVEGYAFALLRNKVVCDVDKVERLELEPNREPTATFLLPTVGYQEGRPSLHGPFEFTSQNRDRYYREMHPQTIRFEIARRITDQLDGDPNTGQSSKKQRVMGLQARHQLFPQVLRIVEQYVASRVDFRGCHPCELGLEKYVMRLVERLGSNIMPDTTQGEPPLIPILNHCKPMGTTAEVVFKTVRPCHGTQRSHINQVVLDTDTWEAAAAFRLENLALRGIVDCYARNDHLDLVIPYEFQGVDHGYEPDFIVRLKNGLRVLLEIKGFADEQTRQKHAAARKWVTAVNNWGEQGRWEFHPCFDPQTVEAELTKLAARQI